MASEGLNSPVPVAASLEDDLDELINSCFSNSPALSIKPLPVPPSLSETPATPMSLNEDDDQFMAWLNEESPSMKKSAELVAPDQSRPVEANLENIFDDCTFACRHLFY
jgi:hypothetical protein